MTEKSCPATAETSPTPRPTIGHILYKTGVPLFIFSIVFSGVLGVSHFAILPTLTAVEVGGETRDAAALEAEAAALRSSLQDLEQERDSDMLPLGGTQYRSLADAKITAVAPVDIMHSIGDIASAVVPGNPKAVHLSRFVYAPGDHSITLSGDVRGVGPSSMTVLAQFTEALRTSPRISAVVAPSFTRLQDPTVGPHSPFTISLTLR